MTAPRATPASLPYADVASALWKSVRFGCGHIEWIYPAEYGDGSAWCSQCNDLKDYDVAEAMQLNECAECGYEDCGPGSCCAACGHIDWRELDGYTRRPVGEDETWRLMLSDSTVIRAS